MKPHQNTIALKPDRTGFAVVMIVFGTSLVACSDLATKWLTANLSLWQLQSMRSVFGISFLLLILLATKKLGSLKVINVEALVIRSLLMTFTYLTFFTALAVLPIAMVAGGFFSGPLFMVVLAAVILKEQIGIWRITSAIGGFIGVLLILQPDFSQLDPMIFLPVVCGFVYALTQVYTRKHCKNEDPIAISFWLTVMFLQSGLLGLFILSFIPLGILVYYVIMFVYNIPLEVGYFTILIIGPLLYISIELFSAKTKKDHRKISNALKLVMLTGVLSLLLYL